MGRKSKPTGPAATAYSYIRFSHPDQAKGDSRRRQEDLRDTWIAKTGAVLDTSLTLRDEGVSAFTGAHRLNPDRNALAAFLELVRRGRIQRGSYLVVESLDRLSREHIRPALTLLLNLIDAGVRIVQLLPVEAVYDESVEPMTLMMAIMELSRGHSESKMKSERVGGAWAEKKREAAMEDVEDKAKGKTPITKRVPAWLRVEGGRFVVDAEKAEAVRRIYRETAAGHGIGAVTKRLNDDKVPTVGPADYWARSYVFKLLTNRAVLGEYQPHTRRGGKRRPEGEPIPAYFPQVVSEDQWHAARTALASRKLKGGQPAERVNLFSGLLFDARDGGRLHYANKASSKGGGLMLGSYWATNGAKGAKHVGFPAMVFEQAVLSCLREIDPREILPADDGAADRVLTLTGKLAEIEGRLDRLKARLTDEDDDGSLVDVLRSLDTKRATTAGQLAEAEREAASPLSGAWGECRTALAVLAKASDPAEARLRLRSALRRIVEGVWCLFVAPAPSESTERKRGRNHKPGRGTTRIAAVQVHFGGGAHRDYLILSRPATGGRAGTRPASWGARSLADAVALGSLDLRKPAHAKRLEKVLAALDPEALAALLPAVGLDSPS